MSEGADLGNIIILYKMLQNTTQKRSKMFIHSALNISSLSEKWYFKKKRMKVVNGDSSKPAIHFKTLEYAGHRKGT